MKNLIVYDWGILDYQTAYNRQKTLHQFRTVNLIPDALILVEHPTVFTIGKNGNLANLLVNKQILEKNKIGLYQIERGGDITMHNPGQLVGYPIFKLLEHKIGVKTFVYQLEQIICDVLSQYHIAAEIKHPLIGVFVGHKKIASIGIAVSKGVSYHGFALNVGNDLSYFNWINPCGIQKLEVTSIKQILNRDVPLDELKNAIVAQFLDKFQLNLLKFELM
ncbi:MAG: lipoyl(octanoyl) transferase LipB [candidate division WOR-3 bacterium]